MSDPAEPAEGFLAHLGLTLTELSGDLVRGTVRVSPDHHQNYGIVHGGLYCSVVEHVASMGAATWYGDRGQVVGLTNVTHFLRAVRDGELAVEATPLHRGRTQQLWQVFITDTEGRYVSKGEVRLANLAGPTALGRS